jgi:hypothetical protein
VIPGNDDALKSVRLLIERLVEGGRGRLRRAPRTERQGEIVPMGDEPRPTRGNKPPPPLRQRRETATVVPGLEKVQSTDTEETP